MDFLSASFAWFVVATFSAFYLSYNSFWRQAVLLGSSLAFISTFIQEGSNFYPFVVFVLAGIFSILAILKLPSNIRAYFAYIAITLLLIGFLFIKTYLPSNFDHSLWLTVGISYIFFRLFQVLSDVADGAINRDDVNIITLVIFLLSFLSFTAGPIQSYQSFSTQLQHSIQQRINHIDWQIVSQRTTAGAVKLLIFTPLISPWLGEIMALQDYSLGLRLGAGASVFLLYIYTSFSGYMDWMVAFGNLLGFQVAENFGRPYRALNFLDLWNHWHISLSSTFKTYVFNPLLRILLLYFIPRHRVLAGIIGYGCVFFLLGAWHGNEMRYLGFGVVLGLLAAITKGLQTLRLLLGERAQTVLNSTPATVISASVSLALLAIACVFTWPGWEFAAIIDMITDFPQVIVATIVASLIAAGIVIVGYTGEAMLRITWLSQLNNILTGTPFSAICWLVLSMILHNLMTVPLSGVLVYYQQF